MATPAKSNKKHALNMMKTENQGTGSRSRANESKVLMRYGHRPYTGYACLRPSTR